MDLFIFFFLDIFWVCLYALFCFVYYSFFVCFCILRKTNTVLAQNEFLNKGQRKGKATLGCWAFCLAIIMHRLRGIEASNCNSL